MREARVTRALSDLKKSQEMFPCPLSQTRRQLLIATGMSAGAVSRLEKGVDAVHPNDWDRLRKSANYGSLIRTMLNRGYSKTKTAKMLGLTMEELEGFLSN